jgi:membrane protease subunit (stomatin/prohibitin family)
MGMGMAANVGGMNIQDLFAMSQKQAAQKQEERKTQPVVSSANGWKCSCGATATGKFCQECGNKILHYDFFFLMAGICWHFWK